MTMLVRIARRVRSYWLSSLRLRMVAVSLVLSLIVVVVIGGFLSFTIERNLFESRRDQIISETQSVSGSVQAQFDSAIDSRGFIDVEGANAGAQSTITATTNSPGLVGFAILRAPGQSTDQVMTSTSSVKFPVETVSTELRDAIHNDRASVHYQSVSLTGDTPGIVTGTNIDVPTAGRYDLVFVYTLADVEQNLAFVQFALAVGGLLFVAFTGLIVWTVSTRAIAPIMTTAETAERFATGNLGERIDVEGNDVSATLATSFNRMAESIEQQITTLATLSTLQQQFVSDVSHELRTPLTTIKLATNMLHEGRDSFDKDTKRAAELLHGQVAKFEELLAELLELSRFDAGAAQLEVEPVSPVSVAQGCIDTISTLATEHGYEISLKAPGGHSTVELDSRRIRRILHNFLSNAIDHGDGKPIEVWVDSNLDAVAFAVRDHGVGMTEDEVDRVFDRFWRADPSRHRRTGGTGLGLAIALGDARLHGGAIDVWARPNEGACFRVTIPRPGVVNAVSPLDLPPSEGDDA